MAHNIHVCISQLMQNLSQMDILNYCIIGNWLIWLALMAAGIEEEGEAGLTADGGGGQAGVFWGGVKRICVDSRVGAEEINACEEAGD